MDKSKEKKPEIIVFAGPNGSGKSTISLTLRPVGIKYINADDIKRVLGIDNVDAAQLAEQMRERCLNNRENFCFETVLSTERNLNLLRRAKESGYFIRCYYVTTADSCINVSRVMSRVACGGHDVPVDKIISRYRKSMLLLRQLIPLCDICHIYDNSDSQPYRIFKKRKEEYFYCPEYGIWNKNDIERLTGINNPRKSELNKIAV